MNRSYLIELLTSYEGTSATKAKKGVDIGTVRFQLT